MNSQNTLEKPTKSTIWIVATIWANIIIVGIISYVVLLVLSSLIIPGLFGLSGLIFVRGWFWKVIIWLVYISAFVYAIRLGIKSVIKKSIILKENIVKISVWVAIVTVIGQLGLIILAFSYTRELIDTSILLAFAGADIGDFAITYFWLKKLV